MSCPIKSIAAAVAFALAVVFAVPTPARAAPVEDRKGDADKNPYELIGDIFGVPPWLLYGIAKVESNLNPFAINWRGRSYHFDNPADAERLIRKAGGRVDVGLGQINCPTWRKVLEVECEELLDPWINLAAMAAILNIVSRKTPRASIWETVGRYHSSRPARSRRYAWKVYKASATVFKNTKSKGRK